MNPYLLSTYAATRRQEFERQAATDRLARQLRTAKRARRGGLKLWTVRIGRLHPFPTP